jgi:arylsulfatase A-like enzyme/Tfp pilus assembly protein PilF
VIKIPRRFLLPLLALVFVTGCSEVRNSPNVVLITLDTTRADHLGCYGHSEPTSPVIDRLAKQGTLFTLAFATNPITLPSHTSIMTSTYPLFHGVRDNTTYVVPDEATTLAELLGSHGYQTAAFVGAFVLDSRFNLDQGFDVYDDRVERDWSRDEIDARQGNPFGFDERKANLVTYQALRWLEQPRSKPFFLWLHYFDPHQPINAPEPHHSRFTMPYDSEIAYAYEQIGKIFEALEERGLYDDSLIVLTADHGEGLLDHGEPTHSLYVFDSTMHVPMIWKVPGGQAGGSVDALVSIVDIMPTVLDLLGFGVPDHIQGRSLAPLLSGSTTGFPGREIYMESLIPRLHCDWGELRALRTATEKLIHGPKPRLYRVDDDPGEVYNRAAHDPEAVQRLSRRLAARMRKWSHPEAHRSASVADSETRQRLAALGYVTSSGDASRGISDNLEEVIGRDDPHEMGHLYDLYSQATESVRMGAYLHGIHQLESVLAGDPDNKVALTALATTTLLYAKQVDKAFELYERSLEIDPTQEEAHYYVSRILSFRGDHEGARRHAEAILEVQPQSVLAYYELGRYYMRVGEPDTAREHYERALQLDPSNTPALLSLGALHSYRGEHELSGKYIKRAFAHDGENPNVLYNYGVWHYQGGDTDSAIRYLTRALAVNPSDADACFVLGTIFLKTKDNGRARVTLQRALKLDPRQTRHQEIERLLAGIVDD